MATDEQKYSSEVNKIAGFGLMTPFGRVFIDPFTLFKNEKIEILI